MPYNNALFSPKSKTNTFSEERSLLDLAKFSSSAFWQLVMFLSLGIVVQALGSNRSVNASSLDISNVRQPTGQTKSNSARRLKSVFLPRIINPIALLTKSQPATLPLVPKLAPLQPIAQSQKLLLADTKSLNKPAPIIHQVKQGETITAIASAYQVSSNDLVQLNRLANSNVIFVNQRLAIPADPKNADLNADLNTPNNADLASIEAASTVTDLAPKALTNNAPSQLLQPSAEDPYIAKLRIEIEQRRAQYKQEQAAKLNTNSPNLISAAGPLPETLLQPQTATPSSQPQLSASIVRRNLKSSATDSLALALPPLLNSEDYLPSAFNGYAWPAQGVLTSGYGWRWGRLHRGIDIAAPIGTPIVAAAAGTVIGSGWHSGYGNLVKLEHLDGSITYYAHNHRNLVTHGQKVKQGEQIAEMGSTGHSTGSHLHFEIHLRDKQIANPLALLGSR